MWRFTIKNFINKYTISIILLVLTTLLITKYYQSSHVSRQTTAFSGKITPLSYTNSTLLNTFNKKNIEEYQTAAGTYDIQTIASQITSTMLTAFSNSSERTLPLVANWNVGIPEYSNGLDPLYIINRFTYGEHLVPTWKLDPYYNDNIGLSYYEASIKKAAELGLPLVFILPSPESALTKDDVYFSMDKTQNPNVITVNGTVLPELSPFGPDSLWNEVGEQWSTTSLIAQLQEWYPNPPLVIFMDEDASKKLSWSELPTSSRYISQYPTNTSNEFKRTLVNAKWLEKYRQLHEGFKQGFIKSAWKQNVKFITRNQLASNMGATADWINSATTTNQYANIWPLTADGLTINFNLDGDKTDTVNTPHTLLSNLPFMLEEAKELNPNFTYQLSIDTNQQIDNSEQYRGFTQFALWFLRPSIIRQTPNKTTKEEINPLFQQVVDSVELVQNSDILADFWKNGKLVSTGTSLYNQNIPTNYQSIPREFLLKTDASGPVWAFALKKGVTPNREWLVYVQSPEENLTNITITVPDFEDVSLDATQEGNFYTLTESKTQNIAKIGTNSSSQNSSTSTSLDANTTTTMEYVSPYLEKITLPQCDTTNPEVQIISSNADWSHINDIDKTIFCVKPGDYSSLGNIKLTTSGTKNKKRYIVLDNGNNIHPGKLNKSELAKVGFILQDTNYWVIDRMAYWENPSTLNPIQIKNSDYNLINRYFMDNVGNGIYLFPGSDNNTIQNCLIQREDISIFHDRAAIGLFNSNKSDISIRNTKIINNEIKNFVDGFQAIRHNGYNLNYEGTIIDKNIIYIDNEIYTDCKGNHDINGNCAYAENAIDLKAGSNNKNNPFIISNNIMFGFRKADTTNSTLGDSGAAIVAHYNVKNLLIKNNFIQDAAVGLAVGDPMDQYALNNSKIINNVFYNIQVYALGFISITNTLVQNNIIKYDIVNPDLNIATNYWLYCYSSINNQFINNYIINSDKRKNRFKDNIKQNVFKNNILFHSLNRDFPESGITHITKDPTISLKTSRVTINKFTKKPMSINFIMPLEYNGLNI